MAKVCHQPKITTDNKRRAERQLDRGPEILVCSCWLSSLG